MYEIKGWSHKEKVEHQVVLYVDEIDNIESIINDYKLYEVTIKKV